MHFMGQIRSVALDKKLDGLLGLNYDQITLGAFREVLLQFELQSVGDFAVEKIGDLADGFFTFQLAPPLAPRF